ncbi:Maltose O-acetyltransferase [Lasiodiplodia theobromae]|uniref:Maltose O-acetyltransferase n=1 Tax=Lasiodiplodia theobromae TaxID=45133 RepID=UPI0015C3BB0D|nr:Maltose O-acetyltransferase [Lasiodiplodia theobromae]KAF4546161.1 Maltose O-acetyltransferase [Lasiodiplodia theobromae]
MGKMAAPLKDVEQVRKAWRLENVPWCEQYERMISGMLYDAFVPDLENARFKARAWSHRYNNYFPPEANANFETLQKTRLAMLHEIIGRLDDDETIIEPPFHIDYGCNISLGKRFYSNFNLTILDCGLVTIGDRVIIGPNVSIFAATHETEVQSRRDNVEFAKPVTIGNDCWIGGHVAILPGVTIGDGCTIGAGAVVTRDIPAWSVAVGCPARVTRGIANLPKIEEDPVPQTPVTRKGSV